MGGCTHHILHVDIVDATGAPENAHLCGLSFGCVVLVTGLRNRDSSQIRLF